MSCNRLPHCCIDGPPLPVFLRPHAIKAKLHTTGGREKMNVSRRGLWLFTLLHWGAVNSQLAWLGWYFANRHNWMSQEGIYLGQRTVSHNRLLELRTRLLFCKAVAFCLSLLLGMMQLRYLTSDALSYSARPLWFWADHSVFVGACHWTGAGSQW